MAPGGSGASELRPRRDGTRWLGKNLEVPRGERGATMEGAVATVGDSVVQGAGKRAGGPPCFAADWARLGIFGEISQGPPVRAVFDESRPHSIPGPPVYDYIRLPVHHFVIRRGPWYSMPILQTQHLPRFTTTIANPGLHFLF